MYHEHPVRILKYSAKNIWLLVFPLLRGVHAFTLDVGKLYSWLRGAWFDIAVLGVILLFGLVRWYFSVIDITDSAVIHTDGIFVRVRTAIPFEKLSTVTVEHSFYLRPFGGMRVYCDTCAGIFKSSDMKLIVSRKVCGELMRKIPAVNLKNGITYHHKPKIHSVLLFSVFFSSSFSGAVYIAAFFFKGGDIAKDIINVSIDRITEETSRISGRLIINIPAAAVGAGILFLATWLISFILNMIRYYGFSVKSDMNTLEIVCGSFTRRRYRIKYKKINYTDLNQNLIMKIFGIVTVSVQCSGYFSSGKRVSVVMPMKKVNELNSGPERLGVCRGDRRSFRPRLTSVWQYIWAPFLTAVLVYPVSVILLHFFPELRDILVFAVVMIEIPAVWMVFVKTAAVLTSRISVYSDRIMIKYSKLFGFHTVVAERGSLVKIEYRQTPFQKISKKCTMSFWFNGEDSRKHSVKAIKTDDAQEIAALLGYVDSKIN